jgi:hypothetical protein
MGPLGRSDKIERALPLSTLKEFHVQTAVDSKELSRFSKVMFCLWIFPVALFLIHSVYGASTLRPDPLKAGVKLHPSVNLSSESVDHANRSIAQAMNAASEKRAE